MPVPPHPPTTSLCLGADEHYFPGLLVATLSTLHGLDPKGHYHFLFLDGGIRDASYQVLLDSMAAVADQRGLRIQSQRVPIELSAFDELPKIWGRSAMTYARILLPDLTPAEHILWVDADMLLFHDLSRFVPQDPERCLLAGVQDEYLLWLERDTPLPPEAVPAQAPYLNCGLLWMNLKRMREQDYKSRVLDFMETHRERLAFWDQTALNNTAIGEVEVLPSTWNRFCLDGNDKELAGRIGEDNLHLVSRDKPWLGIVDPNHGPQPTRDFVFWTLYEHFTGEDVAPRMRWSRDRITTKLLRRARWKRLAYRFGRNPYREAKWKEWEQFYTRVQSGAIEQEVRTAIQSWLQAQLAPKPLTTP